jgi:serpin B
MKSIFINILLVISLLFNSLNCSFQVSIFNELNKSKRGQNLIISPLSIFQILSLTANGAKGETQKEMVKALQGADLDKLNYANYEILEIFQQFKTVEIANAVMSKFTPLKEFTEIAEKYCAPLEKLISVQQVNNWCSEKTHGKITKILDQLNASVQMILINAVYFKGEWSKQFKKSLTKKKTFYNLGTEIKEVDTMNMLDHFSYYEDTKVQAIQLPYTQDGMSALIILPRENSDINKYISSLNTNGNSLSDLISKLKYSKVNLELPKFKLEFFSSLKETLKDMGMTTAFTNNADLTGLREERNLKIDDVLHKTFLSVNENGTEAAAVTAVIIKYTSARPVQEKIYQMKINRPFLFMLRSNKLPSDYDMLFMSKIESI